MLNKLKEAYNTLYERYQYHEDIVKRLNRAMDILTKDINYGIEKVQSDYWQVYKNGMFTYEITRADRKLQCNCPDAERTICKHKIAVYLLTELER